MTTNDSKDIEQKRVDKVADIIDDKIEKVNKDIAKAHSETGKIERNYGENTKVNTFEVDDQMETNASVQQQKQLVYLAVENENILESNKKQLENLVGSPYFGRIDIVEVRAVGLADLAQVAAQRLLGRLQRAAQLVMDPGKCAEIVGRGSVSGR